MYYFKMDQNLYLHYLNKQVNLNLAIEELNCSCTTNKDSLMAELLQHKGQTLFLSLDHVTMGQTVCIRPNRSMG